MKVQIGFSLFYFSPRCWDDNVQQIQTQTHTHIFLMIGSYRLHIGFVCLFSIIITVFFSSGRKFEQSSLFLTHGYWNWIFFFPFFLWIFFLSNHSCLCLRLCSWNQTKFFCLLYKHSWTLKFIHSFKYCCSILFYYSGFFSFWFMVLEKMFNFFFYIPLSSVSIWASQSCITFFFVFVWLFGEKEKKNSILHIP